MIRHGHPGGRHPGSRRRVHASGGHHPRLWRIAFHPRLRWVRLGRVGTRGWYSRLWRVSNSRRWHSRLGWVGNSRRGHRRSCFWRRDSIGQLIRTCTSVCSFGLVDPCLQHDALLCLLPLPPAPPDAAEHDQRTYADEKQHAEDTASHTTRVVPVAAALLSVLRATAVHMIVGVSLLRADEIEPRRPVSHHVVVNVSADSRLAVRRAGVHSATRVAGVAVDVASGGRCLPLHAAITTPAIGRGGGGAAPAPAGS